MMVSLSNSNFCAVVDDEDYEKIQGYSWMMDGAGYVIASVGGKKFAMHRVVKGLPPSSSIHIHHKNGNKLDNRKTNLAKISHRNHSSTTVKDELQKLIEWAKSQGIKAPESMFIYDLRTLKTRADKQSAKMRLFGYR